MRAAPKRLRRRSGSIPVVRIVGQTVWRIFRNPATGVYVGECDALNVTAQGRSRSEFLAMIDDILQTLLMDMLIEGRLEAAAQRLNWKIEDPLPKIPKRGPRSRGVKFDLPFVVPQEVAPNVAAA